MSALEIPGFRIVDIRVPQFAVLEENYRREDPKVSIEIALAHGMDPEQHRFLAGMTITLKQQGKVILKVETQMGFEFSEETYSRFLVENRFRMETDLVLYFTSLLYSTSRGILFSRLEYSTMRGIILQPVNLEDVIDRPLDVELPTVSTR